MHTKEEIDQWLKATGKTRQWLADQCGVTPGRVYVWFSKNQNIPEKSQRLIDQLMDRREDKATTLEVEIPRMDIVIKIPPQEFVTYSNYATACGMTIQEFICYVLEYAGDHKEQIYAYIDARKSYHKNPSEGKASGS